jgi:predicted TIM-barrel fold metal-dependent hydrolase
MDAERDSVAEIERLLASDRQATLLWAHTGHYGEPDLVRRLLTEHPNLYCELSYRLSISASRTAIAMDIGGRLKDAWRVLLEDFPDRFVIGTDIGFASPSLYTQHITFWRRILEQLTPEAAARLAYRNAERLLGAGP